MSQTNRLWLIAGGIPLGLLLFVVAAWGVDTAVTGDRVVRNVVVADHSLGGLDRNEVMSVGNDLAEDLAQAQATVRIADYAIETTPTALGARIDAGALADAALDARRGGFFPLRPFRWLGTFFSEHELTVPYTIDEAAARLAAARLTETELDDPIEPVIDLVNDVLQVTPGADGIAVEPDALIAAVSTMLAAGTPYVLTLDPVALVPNLDTEVLNAIAAEANQATASGADVEVLNARATVEPGQLRSWVTLNLNGATPTWTIDNATAVAELAPKLGPLGSDSQQPHFTIVENRPVIVPAEETLVCCEDDTGERLRAGLMAGTEVITLESKVTGGDQGVAELEALGIIEQVSSFTTNHACCEGRVTNIQLMADIVRGAVVKPGESFSLNNHVGRRTAERGFVNGGAIAQGVMEQQIGGGVSQFATTLFNAAFFAGLNIPEYQSHSIYFSRYPRGREATVSWPKPDLVIHNNTPYGVLIWTSYTGTSITVTMYSTKHIEVNDLGRSESPQGQCTRVTTTRERIWADGRSERDTVFAVYRPSEGLDCAGNPTGPATTTTTTTAPPSTEPTPTTPGTEAPPPTSPTTTTPAPTDPPDTDPDPTDPPPAEANAEP